MKACIELLCFYKIVMIFASQNQIISFYVCEKLTTNHGLTCMLYCMSTQYLFNQTFQAWIWFNLKVFYFLNFQLTLDKLHDPEAVEERLQELSESGAHKELHINLVTKLLHIKK